MIPDLKQHRPDVHVLKIGHRQCIPGLSLILLQNALNIVLEAAEQLRKFLACVGQPKALGIPDKQLHPKILFQRRDLITQSLLRDI